MFGQHSVHRLLVVDAAGQLQGIVALLIGPSRIRGKPRPLRERGDGRVLIPGR